MRKFLITALLLTITITAGAAIAGDGVFWGTKTGALVQNLRHLSPNVAKSRCDSVTGTKQIFKTYTTAGYYGIELDAVDSTGAAVNGKVLLNGKQVAIGTPPFKFGNAGGTAHSSVAFQPYSAAPHTLDLCIRRQ